MKLLDTNFILRFLLTDHPTHSPATKKILETKNEMLFIPDIVVAEVTWILSSFYKLPKEDISDKIYNLLNLNSVYSNRELLIRTLYFYRNFNISFLDSYIAAYCEQEKLEGIYSFDKDLDKIKEIKRLKP